MRNLRGCLEISFSVESIFGLISYSYLVLDIDLAQSSRRSIAPKKIQACLGVSGTGSFIKKKDTVAVAKTSDS